MAAKGKRINDLRWRAHTNNLLEEIITCTTEGAALRMPLLIFRGLLKEIATRASQLNDPELNSLMCRLALYACADPRDKDYDNELTEKTINYK